MCGIAGILNLQSREPVWEKDLRQMLAMLRHRGPDEFGVLLDGPVGLGNARLSIIDLSGGQQPIANEDGTKWIVFNGEIFNYLELRKELVNLGHRFATSSDTEVLVHLFEEYGPAFLERLNGQFALAIWDARQQSLFLARDRLGVRPLFYALQAGDLIFGSEIKAILAEGRVRAQIDPVVLEEVFIHWCPRAPRTIFHGVCEIPPGHYLLARGGRIEVRQYWELTFPVAEAKRGPEQKERAPESYLAELSALLIDAAKLRLRADVPVGAYLSGGLDSSIIAFIIRHFTPSRLDTFSIAFDDTAFDESQWQIQMARFLGTEHQVARVTHADIGRVFPEVIWHSEVPVLRTAPAPMFLLSKLARDCGYKVVLTGEGADEFLAGYDIFKEAKIRRFWAALPESRLRPLLFQRLYPEIGELAKSKGPLLAAFFREQLEAVERPGFSHAIRWRNGQRLCRFFSEEARQQLRREPRPLLEKELPSAFAQWEPLARAQYLEIALFLSEYILSSQGDRMGMAHSVEGRFPFLDYRLVQFCNQLPPQLKLHGLTEKYLLKKLGQQWLPPAIWQRRKRPYRAPISRSFFGPRSPDYVQELLSPPRLRQSGLFNSQAVRHLCQKAASGGALGETDSMAVAGILSTQLVYAQFVSGFRPLPPLGGSDKVKVCHPPTGLVAHRA